MTESFPAAVSPESLLRDANKLLEGIGELYTADDLPREAWTLNDNGKPMLADLFTDIDFCIATEQNQELNATYTSLYSLYKAAERLYVETSNEPIEQLKSEVSELLSHYTEETVLHLRTATTRELAKTDARRAELRDKVFGPLQTKIIELLNTPELQSADSPNNPEHAWFWQDTLPQFLRARSAHGRYIKDTLTHDMPSWTPLQRYNIQSAGITLTE